MRKEKPRHGQVAGRGCSSQNRPADSTRSLARNQDCAVPRAIAFHPVADFFPLMHGADFDALVADIREHGLRESIWLHRDGRIIDGRNRYRACRDAGVQPKTQTYIGPDDGLLDFVVSELPAADDCVLWLWTTHKFLHDAFHILDGWGFESKMTLTWDKERMGMGRWLRSQTEFCLMAVRGGARVDLTDQTTIVRVPRRQHSRKPDEFYEMVESLCIGRRLDYFSRERRKGWEQFGSDAEKFEGAA